jgi:glucose-1-phosphate adenylyltransferase
VRASEFGVLSVTDWNRVTRFTEKPADAESIPGRPSVALASMGIYIFNARLLEKLLIADTADPTSSHDFGKNVIPAAIDTLQVVAYPFTDVKTRAQNYWRDVGTVDAYYEANIELVHVAPELNLYDEEWPIWTYQLHQPPAKFVLDEDGRRGSAVNSMISGGCIISGAYVNQSLLFSAVRVDERSSIFRSVVLPNVKIGSGCTIAQAILDEGCELPPGMQIGIDRAADAARFHLTDNGIVLVTPEMLAKLGPKGT